MKKTVKKDVTCWVCGGKGETKESYGHNDYSWEDCRWCKGKGKIPYGTFKVMQKMSIIYRMDTISKINDKYDGMIKALGVKQDRLVNKQLIKKKAKMNALKAKYPEVDLSMFS